MVSALDSRSGVPGSSPGRGTALCSWARHFTETGISSGLMGHLARVQTLPYQDDILYTLMPLVR